MPMERTVSVADVAKVFLGVNLSRLSKDPAAADIPLINIKDMADGGIAPRESLQQVKPADQDHYRLQDGDVLVSVRGTLLKTARVTADHEGAYASVNIAIVRPTGFIRPETLFALFRSNRVQSELMSKSVASVVSGLPVKSIADVRFRPPAREALLVELIRNADEQYRAGLDLIEERRAIAMDIIDRALDPMS